MDVKLENGRLLVKFPEELIFYETFSSPVQRVIIGMLVQIQNRLDQIEKRLSELEDELFQ